LVLHVLPQSTKSLERQTKQLRVGADSRAGGIASKDGAKKSATSLPSRNTGGLITQRSLAVSSFQKAVVNPNTQSYLET